MATRKTAESAAATVTVLEDGKVSDGNEGFYAAGDEIPNLPEDTAESLKAKGLVK